MSEDNKKVPALRFRGFKDDWEQRKLGELGKVTTGKAFSSVDFDEQGTYLVITNKDISTSSRSQNVVTDRINITDKTIIEKYNLSGESILVTMDGANLGKTAMYSNEKALLAQRVGRIQSSQLEFVYQITSSTNFLMSMRTLSVGNAIKHISLNQISNYTTLVPNDKNEQQRIGSFFKQLDDTIALHQRKLDLLKQMKKGFLQKMFPKNDQKIPELRFNGFVNEWEQRKLGDIARTTIGEFVIKSRQKPNSPYPVYNGGTSYTGLYDEYNNEPSKIVISARGANAGFVNLVETRYWAGNSCYSVGILNEDVYNLHYIYHFMKHNQYLFTAYQQAANIPSVSKNDVEKFIISVTNFEEQQKIGTFFKQLDDTITLHQEKLDKLVTLKKSYLQKLFI